MYKDILLNFLIILTPILAFQLVIRNQLLWLRKSRNWLFGLFCGFASILCMVFPIVSGNQFLWDLRWIPFVLAIIYGGATSGSIAFILLVTYRFSINIGLSSFIVLIDAMIILSIGLFVVKRFQLHSSLKKILYSIVGSLFLYLFITSSIWFHFYLKNDVSFLYIVPSSLYILIGLSYILSMVLSVYFIENTLENARIREEYHKAEKLSMVSELAASIAHEVRNPLTVVRGFIQLVKGELAASNKQLLTTAIDELDRAETIISDYLNFAKPKDDIQEKIHISQELVQVIDLIQSYANLHGVECKTSIEEDLFIAGDRVKFKQIVLNLIKNSIEATNSGGEIQVVAILNKNQVKITIKDNGVGMTKEEINKLGQSYYSTKEKGTGLGVVVTFQLVKSMLGKMNFESEQGKGTITTVTFPSAV
ncbi:sensor histidine kinase [Bacillus timonensis]|nr:sensor histidine kinase [Bacillus timonensis]